MRSNAVSFMENDNWEFKRRGKWRVSEELESAEFCDDITRVKFNFFSLQFKLIIILCGLMYYISSFTPIFPSNCGPQVFFAGFFTGRSTINDVKVSLNSL